MADDQKQSSRRRLFELIESTRELTDRNLTSSYDGSQSNLAGIAYVDELETGDV